MKQQVIEVLKKVKEKRPLIHCITNAVTINDCANIVLAVGGSPIMADDEHEVEQITEKADALVLNIGMLNENKARAMILAGKKANECGIPVVLDPVGVGASDFRKDFVNELLEKVSVSVIRGNQSEIVALSGDEVYARGVDAVTKDEKRDEMIGLAYEMAKKHRCIIIVSGEKDIVAARGRYALVQNGTKEMRKVTGAGCMTTAILGTFLGVEKDLFVAAVSAMVVMGIAAEKAKNDTKEKGVGSFHIELFNKMEKIEKEDIEKRFNCVCKTE